MNKLKLSYPVETVIISQVFGVKGQFYTNQGMLGHNGLDMMAQDGYPVYAMHDGLTSCQIDAGGGHGVVIVTDKEYDDENGGQCLYKSIYWHLVDGYKYPKWKSPFQDKTGFTKVRTGELIGYADNTGASSGSHLHIGLKRCLKGEDWGTFENLDQMNGYHGAINPMPFFNGSYPQTIHNLEAQVNVLQKIVDLLKQLFKTPK